tara:strand:- start:2 stop:250 length:249 start_codon:yes stop_codon:yes gene_type:complete
VALIQDALIALDIRGLVEVGVLFGGWGCSWAGWVRFTRCGTSGISNLSMSRKYLSTRPLKNDPNRRDGMATDRPPAVVKRAM